MIFTDFTQVAGEDSPENELSLILYLLLGSRAV